MAVTSTEPTPYEAGLHHLAWTVQEMLSLAYFHRRLTKQIAAGAFQGVNFLQAQHSLNAWFKIIIIDLSKLLESNKQKWNLRQLYEVWRPHINDEVEEVKVLDQIESLRTDLKGWLDVRHERTAHQAKSIPPTSLSMLSQLCHRWPNPINEQRRFTIAP